MNDKLLRLAYAIEFLIALLAIFTAWSEIGGQAALDLMHWGFKFALSLLLASAFTGFTAALVSENSWWTPRPLRWLAAIIVIVAAMGVITYFYSLQVEAGDSDDTTNTTQLIRPGGVLLA